MNTNEHLSDWGEPPASANEQKLADLLADLFRSDADVRRATSRQDPECEVRRLLEIDNWIEEMMETLLERSGVLENLPPPADAGSEGESVHLVISVSRKGPTGFQPVASTQPLPCVLRDLRRVPPDPDRVRLSTGDRIRIELLSDRSGHIILFNLGPQGGVNLLYPHADNETGVISAGSALQVLDVELTPPAGRERIYALWSKHPLARSTGALRDLKRIEEKLAPLTRDQWHAVLLELDHVPS